MGGKRRAGQLRQWLRRRADTDHVRVGHLSPPEHAADGVAGAPGFWLLVPGSLGFMGVTQLLGAHSTAVFTATLISMMSIAVGVQTGLLLWRAAIQLTSSPDRRAMHD